MPGALRVPELAPALGRLIVPRRRTPPWVPIDDIREQLATAVLELAGEGRRAAQQADGAAALQATGRAAWLDAWERGVRAAAERVAGRVDAELEVAARRVRMPRRHWRSRLLVASERRAIAARLAAGGGAYLAALDDLAAAAERVHDARAPDPDAQAAWQEALRAAARRLEAAWLALEREVEAERARWQPEIDDVARWRPSLLPIIWLWIPAAAALLWLGLVMGGYLPAPPWLARLLGF